MPSNIQVQSYALVLVADRHSLQIHAASTNAADICGLEAQALLEVTLHDLFDPGIITQLCEFINNDFPAVVPIGYLEDWSEGEYQAIVFTEDQELVIEIEPRRSWPHSGDYSARLNNFTFELEANPSPDDLLRTLCDGLTFHFGYDRAVILQFDENGDGIVTHEAKKDSLPSLLDVRFVEPDVPAVSRRKQLTESVLNFVSVESALVSMHGEFADQTEDVLRHHIACREPNPNFVQYLRDSELKTLGHLSLIIDGKLWGSVYMHSEEPVYIDYQMRAFLRIAGRVAQQKIGYHTYHRGLRMQQKANSVRDRLYEQIVKADHLASGLTEGTTTLLDLLPDTGGAAICSDDDMTLFEKCPNEEQVNDLMKWVKEEVGDTAIWHTDHLRSQYPAAADIVAVAAGVFFLPLDPDANQWILWFRPEIVQEVSFGSRPRRGGQSGQRYFGINKRTRREHSLAWGDEDFGYAEALQFFIQKTVMERYASTRRQNVMLQEAVEDLEVFSYTIGHDLRAPLRGISSYAEILLEDFGKELGPEGESHLQVIQKNAYRMRTFMDDLLTLSRIERSRMLINRLSVPKLVQRVLEDLSSSGEGTPSCEVQEGIPPICGDHNHMVIVFTNLLSNAFKYSAQEPEAHVRVGFTGEYRAGSPVFYVSDNGIGIPKSQQPRMFELFSRSTNSGDFDGTGIGLALVQRIIRFHDGEVWIESKVGEGTRILFYTGVAVSA